MTKSPFLLLLFIFITPTLVAQVLPKEGSLLNYRLIGFSFPTVKQEGKYKIEIAAGNYNSKDSFKKNIIKTIDCQTGKTIGEVPSFAKQYTWRVTYKSDDPTNTKNTLYHFSTGIIPQADTANTRLRVIKNAETYQDAYVFLDGNRALYDMNGNPVWYLPYIGDPNIDPRDLKLTLQGTITFLQGEQALEVNYNGDILWKGPNDGKVGGDSSSEHYHHELTKLANGHYMVLGNERVTEILPVASRDNHILAGDKLNQPPGNTSVNVEFGTIIEYDEKNNMVWSWKSSKCEDAQNIKGSEAHENAFFFDENTKMIYIGFKDISRIIKVKYPEGTVMNVLQPDISGKGNNMFCGQHSCGITHDGYVYVFNNNDCNWPDPPSIVMMQQPVSEKDTLKKIWEYTYEMESTSPPVNLPDNHKNNRPRRTTGGNVIELPDGGIFSSLNTPYGNVFIVNRDKKLLWNAIAEKRKGTEWKPYGQYRASIITNPKDLERLIWNQEQSISSIQ